MDRRGLRVGQLVAAWGAAGLGLSLFAPWFKVGITAAGKSFMQGMVDRFLPGFHDVVANGLAAFPASASGSAWRVFGTVDVLLALGAGLVLVLTVVAAGAFGSATADGAALAARLTTAVGLVAGGLIVHALVRPPIGDGHHRLSIGGSTLFEVHSRWGAWLGLAGAIVIVVGGWLALSAPRPAPLTSIGPGDEPEAPPTWATQGSVAPPSS
jgi:hypothetical protein